MQNIFLRNKILYQFSRTKGRFDELLKILHDFTDQVILARRNELMKLRNSDDLWENKKEMTFLDILLQSSIDGQPLSNLDIRDEVSTFILGGHDTTSSAISFCLYNLAKNPKIQQKAFEEVQNVFGDDKEATYSDLKSKGQPP